MRLPDFLTQCEDGEIRITDHRIGLYHLIHHYNEGDSAEMLASRYPTLPLPLVHKLIAYYLENQAEVDAYLANCAAAMQQQRKSAREADIGLLRQRLANGNASPATREIPVN
jgi:uncharacterized protein (DUF433 family)